MTRKPAIIQIALHAILAIVGTFSFPAMASEAFAPTIIRDRAAAERLRGNEGLTLQWIDWAERGTLNVRQPGDTILLNGIQKAAAGQGLLTLDGQVTEIDAHDFRFRGRIVIRDTPDVGRQCVRDGDFTFTITQDRHYWRLQQMEMCDGLTDYVDIYF